jgi:tetratricopeptide (TPR) repeat protein
MRLFGKKDKSNPELKGRKLNKFHNDFADLFLAEKFEKCVELAESYLEKYPYDIHVNKNLVDAYSSTGNYEKNKTILENAIKHHPKSAYFRKHLANVYSELFEFEKMVEVLKEGLELELEFEAGSLEEEYMKTLEKAEGMQFHQRESIHCIKEIGARGVLFAYDKDYGTVRHCLNILEERRESALENDSVKTLEEIDRHMDKIKKIMGSWDVNQSKDTQIQNNHTSDESLIEVLKSKLTSGEITKEEYNNLKSIWAQYSNDY